MATNLDQNAQKGASRVRLNACDAKETFQLEYEVTLRNIIVYVPGTTDPINLLEKDSADASLAYWDSKLLANISKMASRAEVFSIDQDFSWSGDNNINSRIAAGEKLQIYLFKKYPILKVLGQPLHIHFVCHSHGGNVINEFTKIAAANSDFPKHFQVRSIVYLSTPFFKNQAQLDHTILHPQCKIINVYNEYDLTQRFVANFSMHQMPGLIASFESDETFNAALKRFKNTSFLALGAHAFFMTPKSVPMLLLSKYLPNPNGKALWQRTLDVFTNLEALLSNAQSILGKIGDRYPKFITPAILGSLSKGVIAQIVTDLSGPIQSLRARLARDADYSMSTLFTDVGPGIGDLIQHFNDFIKLTPRDPRNPNDLTSNLMAVVGQILLNQIDTFDNTTHTPKPQLRGKYPLVRGKYPLVEIDVTGNDPYHGCPESARFGNYISNLELLEDQYELVNPSSPPGAATRTEIVFQLLAQFDTRFLTTLDNMLSWLDRLLGGRTEQLIRLTRQNLQRYMDELKKRNQGIIHVADRDNDKVPFAQKKGGIAYLAVESHSVSRRALHPSVEKAWSSEFPLKGQAPKVCVRHPGT